MAHEINQTQRGASAAFAIQPAWHGLGAVLDHVMTWREAYTAAKLDFIVEKRPLYYAGFDGANPSGTMKEVRGTVGTFRKDTNDLLGVVGDKYEIVQNDTAFEFVDTLLGVADGAHYESAGALRLGERIWCLARIPQGDISVGGDQHLSYLLFVTSHDGSLASQAKIVQTRVVCANTLAMSLNERGASWKFKHTYNVESRMAMAKAAFDGVITNTKQLEVRLNRLAHQQVKMEQFASIMDRLFPATKAGSGKRDKIVLKIMELFESNDNNAFAEQRGTAYAMLNAITDFTDHHRGVRQDTRRSTAASEADLRAENALFGGGADLKASAVAVIEDVMKDTPETSVTGFSFDTKDNDFLKSLNIKGL